MHRHFYDDDFDDETFTRRQSRTDRKRRKPAPAQEIAEADGLTNGIQMSYQPARFEEVWLTQSLASFYQEQLIVDVQASIKGGKEASVYRCAADPSTGYELLAAKVYRPRQFRNLRNDSLYREGRDILTADGRPVKKTDHRLMRAIGKKTAVGQQLTHTSWLMYEYNTLNLLHTAGAAVPKPIAVNENALLMTYHGDAQVAAPTLNGVRPGREEAVRLFGEILDTIERMLSHGFVHGDLSAYNILYWEGALTVIDFPQVTMTATNRHAYDTLLRDVTRVCDYFQQQGVQTRPHQIARRMWEQYAPADAFADDMLGEGII